VGYGILSFVRLALITEIVRKTMSDTFTIERPEYLSDSAWEALCEAVERYVEEWEEWEDEDDND
jgi:histone H3/H4